MSAMSTVTMPRPKRDDTSVKISSAVYRKAKMVAAYRGITLAEYLSSLLESPVDQDYQQMHDSIGEEKAKGKGKGKKA